MEIVIEVPLLGVSKNKDERVGVAQMSPSEPHVMLHELVDHEGNQNLDRASSHNE